MLPNSSALQSGVDAREDTRARQPGRADLVETIVVITQAATGRRQAVRVVAPDQRPARALAMLHCTLLDGVPHDLDPPSLALRHLELEVSPDEGSTGASPGYLPLKRGVPAGGIKPGAEDRAYPSNGDYTTYSVVIATDPRYWTASGGTETTILEARRRAEVLADMARNAFTGLRCDLVRGPVEKLDLSSGPDTGVREELEAWVDWRMGEMIGGTKAPGCG